MPTDLLNLPSKSFPGNCQQSRLHSTLRKEFTDRALIRSRRSTPSRVSDLTTIRNQTISRVLNAERIELTIQIFELVVDIND